MSSRTRIINAPGRWKKASKKNATPMPTHTRRHCDNAGPHSARAKTPSVVNVSLHSATSTPKTTEQQPAPHTLNPPSHPTSHHHHHHERTRAASAPRSARNAAQHAQHDAQVPAPRRTPVPSTYSASAASLSSFGGGRGGAEQGGLFSGPPSTIGEQCLIKDV